MTKKTTKENPLLLTIERIVTLHPKMSETEKQALAEWERTNLGDGVTGTTDWPGWREVIARLSH